MMAESSSENWRIFKGQGAPRDDWELPPPPGWRPFGQNSQSDENRRSQRAETFQPQENAIDMVNAAMYLRRPLLITGRPGTGKSSLAYAVARELKLGEVLYWPITTRTTLKNGLYDYDAIGRLQDAQQQEVQRQEAQRRIQAAIERGEQVAEPQVEVNFAAIGDYITLGPLGTALIPSEKPRVLLIDEIDKSDIDLPNDLLTILEEGRFEIRELVRIKEKASLVPVRTSYSEREQTLDWQPPKHTVENGVITCTTFPLIFLTSNGERAFPPAFLRRCLRLQMKVPTGTHLQNIVRAHLEQDFQARKQAIAEAEGETAAEQWYESTVKERDTLIETFEKSCKAGKLISTDQLLNTLFLLTQEHPMVKGKQELQEALMKQLTSAEDG